MDRKTGYRTLGTEGESTLVGPEDSAGQLEYHTKGLPDISPPQIETVRPWVQRPRSKEDGDYLGYSGWSREISHLQVDESRSDSKDQ